MKSGYLIHASLPEVAASISRWCARGGGEPGSFPATLGPWRLVLEVRRERYLLKLTLEDCSPDRTAVVGELEFTPRQAWHNRLFHGNFLLISLYAFYRPTAETPRAVLAAALVVGILSLLLMVDGVMRTIARQRMQLRMMTRLRTYLEAHGLLAYPMKHPSVTRDFLQIAIVASLLFALGAAGGPFHYWAPMVLCWVTIPAASFWISTAYWELLPERFKRQTARMILAYCLGVAFILPVYLTLVVPVGVPRRYEPEVEAGIFLAVGICCLYNMTRNFEASHPVEASLSRGREEVEPNQEALWTHRVGSLLFHLNLGLTTLLVTLIALWSLSTLLDGRSALSQWLRSRYYLPLLYCVPLVVLWYLKLRHSRQGRVGLTQTLDEGRERLGELARRGLFEEIKVEASVRHLQVRLGSVRGVARSRWTGTTGAIELDLGSMLALNPREREAILWHEVGHRVFEPPPPPILLRILLNLWMESHTETTTDTLQVEISCDRFAAEIQGNAGPLISALGRLAQEDGPMPPTTFGEQLVHFMRLAMEHRRIVTHPHLSIRLEALRELEDLEK